MLVKLQVTEQQGPRGGGLHTGVALGSAFWGPDTLPAPCWVRALLPFFPFFTLELLTETLMPVQQLSASVEPGRSS